MMFESIDLAAIAWRKSTICRPFQNGRLTESPLQTLNPMESYRSVNQALICERLRYFPFAPSVLSVPLW